MEKTALFIICFALAIAVAALPSLQAFAAGAEEKYISEIKVGTGKRASDAEKALSGYEILKDGSGKYVDLNKGSGGGTGSKGDMVVYLGYKKTADSKEAITDLAVMNMKGGYSVQEYEILMEHQMKSQIIPFVESFIAAIKEYRINYDSSDAANRQRARYIHNMLNKLTDDDCGGAGLGDLFLNETKYEMGDAAYNALTDEEKNRHADILTIIAQADGRAVLTLENLLTRAADTGEDTWFDRFAASDYDTLADETGLSPSKAAKQLAKLYDDDAVKILEKWDGFRDELLNYDYYADLAANYDEAAVSKAAQDFEGIDANTSPDEIERRTAAYEEAQKTVAEMMNAAQLVDIYDRLGSVEYLDSTMLDFFLRDYTEVADDISSLYPIVAALSKGQRTGLDFISLRELFCVAFSENYGVFDKELANAQSASIYDGVDRGIYQKGGVALTSDALRAEAARFAEQQDKPSVLMMILWGITITLGAAAAVSTVAALKAYVFASGAEARFANLTYEAFDAAVSKAWKVSGILTKMTIGLGLAAGIMGVATEIINAARMRDYYNVEFSPIPHYMIDEKDLIGYNSKGEKIVLKNQSAYYKAVTTNRSKGDNYYDDIGDLADLNGAVGKQWLALYAEKNEAEAPILAHSLKAVTDSAEIPAGYTTGIHSFGTDAAENINNTLYVWNSAAKSVYVYYQTDGNPAPGLQATAFSYGSVAMTCGAGFALGAVLSALCMTAVRKKKPEVSG